MSSIPHRNESGFSLLELVVAVSIMLILAVIGFVWYQNYTDNARQAVVERAADDVFTAAAAQLTSGDFMEYRDIVEQYNAGSEIDVAISEADGQLTVTATGDRGHSAVRTMALQSTAPDHTETEDTPEARDIDAYSDGVLTFTVAQDNTATFFADLSTNATLTHEDGTVVEMIDGGVTILPTAGEYTLHGGVGDFGADYEEMLQRGLEYIDLTELNFGIESITAWENTGTVSASGAFIGGNGTIVEPPETVKNMSSLFYGARSIDADLTTWDTSNIKNMRAMFLGAREFNQDISGWDTSNVEDMGFMFSQTEQFDQNLSSWDVSNVHSMDSMFSQAKRFNNGGAPIVWDSGNVETMRNMFTDATAFNQDISDMDVSSVVDMYSILSGMDQFNNGGEPLDWGDETGNVENMGNMFNKTVNFDQDISGWDTSSVTDMHQMFTRATAFNNGGEALDWDVSQVTNMHMMFAYKDFNQDITMWDTGKVQRMTAVFRDNSAFNQDISNWDMSNVETADSIFYGAAAFDQNISAWDMRNVESMSVMFKGATQYNNGGEPLLWETPNVENMYAMFQNAANFNQPLPHFTVDNVTTMQSMFHGAEQFNQPLENWNTSNVEKMQNMFRQASSFNQDIGYWDVSSVENVQTMFSGATAFMQDLSSWELPEEASINRIQTFLGPYHPMASQREYLPALFQTL